MRVAFLVLASIAVAISLRLYGIQHAYTDFSACSFAGGLDCAPALLSKYGKIFDYSLSLLGLFFYSGMLLLGIPKGPNRTRTLALIAMTFAGTIFCGYLVWVSLTKLSAYCPYCLGLHILTPLLLAVSLRMHAQQPPAIGFHLGTVGVLTLVALLSVPGAYLLREYERDRFLEKVPMAAAIFSGAVPRVPAAQVRQDLRLDRRPFLGREDAKVTIIEVADFTCGSCRDAHEEIMSILSDYPVKFYFIAYPTGSECNPAGSPDHYGSCLAGLALHSAPPERFWAVHAGLFEDGGLLTASRGSDLARLAGAPSINAILRDTAAGESLGEDVALLSKLGIITTPSLVVNGIGLTGMPPSWLLRRLIERELENPDLSR
jgi:uncharacterized membrane protein/protein-disulfide isomerase